VIVVKLQLIVTSIKMEGKEMGVTAQKQRLLKKKKRRQARKLLRRLRFPTMFLWRKRITSPLL